MNMNTLDEKFREIKEWLSSVSFKKAGFGGVDEADVWKKIDELNSLYEKALIAALAEKNSGGVGSTDTPGVSGKQGECDDEHA